jgi:hypothetical protein
MVPGLLQLNPVSAITPVYVDVPSAALHPQRTKPAPVCDTGMTQSGQGAVVGLSSDVTPVYWTRRSKP